MRFWYSVPVATHILLKRMFHNDEATPHRVPRVFLWLGRRLKFFEESHHRGALK